MYWKNNWTLCFLIPQIKVHVNTEIKHIILLVAVTKDIVKQVFKHNFEIAESCFFIALATGSGCTTGVEHML